MANPLRIPFPLKGKDANWAVSGQPPLTSPDLQNVRPRDVQAKRSRGGQRPGMRKVMYWWDYPGDGADLGLPTPAPIIGMAQVTAVYYASVAGEAGASYVDPTGGDPKWDGIVLWSGNDEDHEVQVYSFTGNSIFEAGTGGAGTNQSSGLALDKIGNIYAYDSAGIMKKWDKAGNELASRSVSPVIGRMWPSSKDDDIVFWAASDTLYILNSEDLTSTSINRGFGSRIDDIVQLRDSDDIIISLAADSTPHINPQAERVSRLDLTNVTDYDLDYYGSTARSVAADEDNGWLYTVVGTRVFRMDLSDGGNVQTFVIAGTYLHFVRLYGGKVYVCGTRADDNNTIWKLDAALVGIEADYDTGNGTEVHQMRILSNGTVYAVGSCGTNEDAEEGNVNVLTSALVHSDTWNVRAGKEMDNIAEKWE